MESMNDVMNRIQSQHLIGKFRNKEDLYRYLVQQVGLFLPTQEGTKISLLKALLSEEKKAFKTFEIKMIEIPNYPEISVTDLYDYAMNDPDGALSTYNQSYNSLICCQRETSSLVFLQLLNQSIQMKSFKKLTRNATASLLQKKRSRALKSVTPGCRTAEESIHLNQAYPSNFIEKPGTAMYLMKERSKLNRERKSQVKHELSKRLYIDLQKQDEFNIDAGTGTKKRNIGPSKPQEEEKKEKPNKFTGKFNM